MAAAALLLAGCGGSSGQTSAAAPPPIPLVRASALSKAQFLKRADAVCTEGAKRLELEFRQYLRSIKFVPSRSEILRHAGQFFDRFQGPSNERQLAGIRALGAPRGDERKVTAILNAMQDAIAAARRDPAAYFYGGDPFGHAYKLAALYGLRNCAVG